MKNIIGGIVEKHKGRGKELGFPTANIRLNQQIPEGIYISQTKIGSDIYNSLTFVGFAKTFSEEIYQAETYILDFSEDLYNMEIIVHLLKKIRENQKFGSVEELVEQMNKDEEEARRFFAARNNAEQYAETRRRILDKQFDCHELTAEGPE